MPPKRRRRFQGLYYHSSPPKVLPMNGQVSIRKRREADDFSVKLSTIRIWMHEKDIGKLTRILWAGQGNRLRQQASTNAKVKRFLAAVPYAMNNIKDVHQAVVDNTLETLQANLEPPVPPALITCKDANGLNVIHKAAGLGHAMILEYLISVWPDGVHETDITGKTPLHWAASCKNNMRCYTLLTNAGCDEEAQDYKMKTPSYYRHKPNEIERAFLIYVPDAPRVSREVSTDWEAFSDDNGDGKKLDIKIPETATNGFHDRSSDTVSDAGILDGENNIEEIEESKIEELKVQSSSEVEKIETPELEALADTEESEENQDNEERKLNDLNKDATYETAEMVDDTTKVATEVIANTEDMEWKDNEKGNEVASKNVVTDQEQCSTEGKGVLSEDNTTAEPKEDAIEQGANEVKEKHDNKDNYDTEISNNQNQKETTEKTLHDDQQIDHIKDSTDENSEVITETKENEKVSENSDTIENKDNATDKAEDAIESNDNEKDERDDTNVTDEIAKLDENAAEVEEINVDIDDNNELNTNDVIIKSEIEIVGNEINTETSSRPYSNVVNKKQNKLTDPEDSNDDDDDQDALKIAADNNLENTPDEEMKNDEVNESFKAAPENALDTALIADNYNENNNAEKQFDVESPTSSLAIEGFVQGESEDNTVQSQSAAFVDEESHIQTIIASGDMEQLALIVLNGDGSKLLCMQAPEAEIQAFLNNVPNYMSKIRRVHEAARNGKIMELQQALDRRKFAIAKDEISPNGASPLHVAVLFGHSDIVRYLAARFPETTGITDNDGRTALHYAAAIKDNGHFYNVLAQLGANPKAVDNLGHTPEYYLEPDQPKDSLTYSQLLNNFGAPELEEELLSDQVPDDLHSSRRLLQDIDTARTLDRCFSVIQESSKMLSGATATALTNRKPLSASSLQVSVTSYLSRFLKRSIYEKIKKRQTRLDHNLFDVIWPAMRKTSKQRYLEEDINCGIIAPDFDVYVVFQEFLVPLIKDMHCMSITADFKPHPRLAYFPMEDGERLNTAGFIFDDDSNLIQRCLVECSRNLEAFELPLNLTIGQLEQAERLMMSKLFNSTFAEAIGDNESGNYYTLTEIIEDNSGVYAMLSKLELLIPLLDTKDTVQAAESMAFNGTFWPYGRGVFINAGNDLALWLNCQEHLRIISTTNASNAADLGAAYTRVGRAVSYLETHLHFKESYLLGYLQARPSYLGTGLKMSTTIRLPNLMKEMDNLRHLCSVRGLSIVTIPKTNLHVRLVNMQSLGTIEYVLFQDYSTAITNILSLEKDMSLTNSKHIATMLVKIFRRKKNSIVDRN